MRFLSIAAVALSCTATTVPAATLSDLFLGGTLTAADVVFSNFEFEDLSFFPDDLTIDPAEIEVTASEPTASSVSLTFSFIPTLAVSSLTDVYFGAFIDFDAAVSGSSRTFESVQLSAESDAITATGDGLVEVNFIIGSILGPSVSVYDDPAFRPEKTSDATSLGNAAQVSLLGDFEGETLFPESTASLSGFTLTFELDGAEPEVIPLPASLPLLLAGMLAFGALRRRR